MSSHFYKGKGRYKPKHYTNSVERSSDIVPNDSVTGLKAAKIAVVVLMAAVLIVGAVFAAPVVFNRKPQSQTVSTVSQDQQYVADEDDEDEILLRVVNKRNPLSSDFAPELGEYSVNVIAEKPLKNLLAQAEKDGVELSVKSAYISYQKQDKLFKSKQKSFIDKGYTEVTAQAQAEKTTPRAGCSEAQTGLLVTFATDGGFDGSAAQFWLNKNCVEFGFVPRYPESSDSIGTLLPNPKVFRYVGVEHAKKMRTLGKNFDEYVSYMD